MEETMEYKPEQFKKTFNENRGKELLSFLREPDNIIRMKTSTYLSRPALAPLSDGLVERFGRDFVSQDQIKRLLGHMTKSVMDDNGYDVEQSKVRINIKGNIFTTATRYVKR